jgi:ABC-type enterochelin transport system permease subunit
VLAGCLFRPGTLVGPFLFNGLFYALVTREWLATQHVLALFGGLALTVVPGFLSKNQRVLQSMTKR